MNKGTIEKQAYLYECVASMYSIVASIEGMKAANQYRLECGHQIAYDEEQFHFASVQLKAIAAQIGELR